MPDTGIRLPQAQSGWDSTASAVIDDTVAADDNSPAAEIMTGGETETAFVEDFAGDDLPAGATVVGVEIQVKMGFAINQATSTFAIGIGGAGGSFSSTTVSQATAGANGAATTIYDLGAADEDFGLDWSGFTDMTDLAVKVTSVTTAGTSATSIQAVYLVRLKLTYTEVAADPPHAKVRVMTGRINILDGQVTIK